MADQTIPKGKVLIVLTSATPTMADGSKSGYFWSEVYHPFEVFTKAGYAVDTVSLTGSATVDEHSIRTAEQLMMMEVSALAAWKDASHPLHKAIAGLKAPAAVSPADYRIIFFAGGHACLWDLPTATPIQALAASIYEAGGVVAAVCHGPAVFGGLKLSNGQYLVAGKRVNAFTVEEEDKMGQLEYLRQQNVPLCSDLITKAGGIYEKGGVMKEYVVVDGRLVTGQNPASAQGVAQQAVAVAEGKQ